MSKDNSATMERLPQAVDSDVERKRRADLCGKEVGEVLAKHGCRIVPFLRSLDPLVPGAVKADYGIFADPR